MGLGAFAGGVVKGYQAINDTINTNKRTAIAEQDQALRQRASDREETRYKREQTEWEKKDELERQYAENIKNVFGTPATPDSTGTMTGPLDAKDARAGTMDGVQTAFNIPGQAQTGDGGMGGVNLMDPANHGKMLKLEALNMQSRMRAGMVKPEEVRQFTEWGKKMEADGMSQAFGRFIMGDTKALDEIAKRNGVKSYSTVFGKDEEGMPALMFKIEGEDGNTQVLPASIVAAGLGATGFINTLDKLEDNATNRYKAKALGDYYETQGQAALDRVGVTERLGNARLGIERDKAGAYIDERTAAADKHDRYEPGQGRSGSGSSKTPAGPAYDSTVIRKAIKDMPLMVPNVGKKSAMDDGKPVKDTGAMERAVEIGTYYVSIGRDPAESEAIARSLVRKANDAAAKQVGPDGKREEFLKVRDQMLDAAVSSAKKANKPKEAAPAAAPARNSAFPKIDPATQKARDTDRVGILRQERQAEESRLAALKAKPIPGDKDYADAVSRAEKNLIDLDSELRNAAKTASAFRTR